MQQWQAGSRIITWNEFDAIEFGNEITIKEAQTICAILNAKNAVPKMMAITQDKRYD